MPDDVLEGSEELEAQLKSKTAVTQKYVGMCRMNQCTRGGPGLVIALDVSEGIVNQAVEAHRNAHRQHEKEIKRVLAQHREKKNAWPTLTVPPIVHGTEDEYYEIQEKSS